MVSRQDLHQIGEYVYEVPASFRPDMRAPARLYADEATVANALADRSVEQLVNTASLPGIAGPALAMPDIHQGYGLPIGAVVAAKPKPQRLSASFSPSTMRTSCALPIWGSR